MRKDQWINGGRVVEDWARYSGRLSHAAKDDEGVTRMESDERTIGKSTLLYLTTDNVHQS